MKNSVKLFIPASLLVFALISYRCSILEQNVDGEFSTLLNIYEAQTGSNITYSSVQALDAASDQNIADNLDKIKDWTVTEASYKIWGFNGVQNTTMTGTIGFGSISSASASVTASVSNVDLSVVAGNDTKYILNLSESDLNKIAALLDKDHAVNVYIDGVLSQGPASTSVEVFAKVKVKTKL